MSKHIVEAETACMYCKVAGVCPACDGEGVNHVEQNVPPYEYLSTCEDCKGSGICPVCRYNDLQQSRKALERNTDVK